MTMKSYPADDFRHAFQHRFDPAVWQGWLVDLFGATKILQRPQPVELPPSEAGSKGWLLGELTTPDDVEIGFFRYTVPAAQIERRRVGLNSLVGPWLKWGFDAALVVFDAKETTKWRCSLVADMRGAKTSPKRYTFVFGDPASQHRTAVDRFMKVAGGRRPGRPVEFEALKEAFEVGSLTKEFYGELFGWYLWALSPEAGVRYPDVPPPGADERPGLEEHLIRLITRLMFVWFIRQKKLVPAELFDKARLTAWLKDFDPHSMESGAWYNAILQNLSFATLNDEIAARRFADERAFQGKSKDHGIKTLFRDRKDGSWFKRPHEDVLKLFREVPFLNGGLFECLDGPDRDDPAQRVVYRDGFSREEKHCAFIPYELFFGGDEMRTFTALGQQTRKKVPGLLEILGRYNFTIEENTPDDMDVALDPELLGKVFENLLGSFNPETRETARNASGSFYTPREIVGYMVDEALDAYMAPVARKTKEEQLDHLLRIKVLDPECCSGAFPMGMLGEIVARARELGATDDLHALKLRVIQECIFGVDIQGIAVQIAKLRFFISLVCEAQPDLTDVDGNFGVPPLPNLETKFVAADALVAKRRQEGQLGLEDPEIAALKVRLDEIRRAHFSAKTRREKLKLRERDAEARKELAALLKGGAFSDEDARQIAEWDPYDQNRSAPFFDPEWMFGVDGFDVVIGNPPYISAPDQLKSAAHEARRALLAKDPRFTCLVQKWDLYVAFIEISLRRFLRDGGVFAMIVPYPFANQTYGARLRKLIVDEFSLCQLVDLQGVKVFENATVTNCIPIVTKSAPRPDVPIVRVDETGAFRVAETLSLAELMPDERTCVWKTTKDERLLDRFGHMRVLGDYCYISVGMVLNADEKTAKGEFSKQDLISETEDETHPRRYIEAKDIGRYEIRRIRWLEWGTERCPGQLRRATFPELYETPKLMFNRLGELQVVLDGDGHLTTSDAMFMGVLWHSLRGVENKSIATSVRKFSRLSRGEMERLSEGVGLRFLLGVMNSRMASALLTDLRGGDYHIYPEHIRNIPIPPATPTQQ
ncbi:MAG: Eco57I restriction-modification methylase domain-containing protein, partial [Synergistaceae bacterium]|nr:Eco57I restriction-modification methylase domain-containing protein [Synergistaceae bacterium]